MKRLTVLIPMEISVPDEVEYLAVTDSGQIVCLHETGLLDMESGLCVFNEMHVGIEVHSHESIYPLSHITEEQNDIY